MPTITTTAQNVAFFQNALQQDLDDTLVFEREIQNAVDALLANAEITEISGRRIVLEAGDYALTIDGARFSPVNSADALLAAIDDATARGNFSQFTLSEGNQTLLTLTPAASGWTLASGQTVIQIDGALPRTVSDIYDLLDAATTLNRLGPLDDETLFGPDARGAVRDLVNGVNVSGFSVSQGGAVQAALSLGADEISATYGDVVLTLGGSFPADLGEFAELAFDLFDAGLEDVESVEGVSIDSLTITDRDGDVLLNATDLDEGGAYEVTVDGVSYGGLVISFGDIGLVEYGEATQIRTPNSDGAHIVFMTDTDDFIELLDLPDTASATVPGSDGEDVITGTPGDDLLSGGNGIDNIDGDAGDDTLYGGADGDFLSGWDGDDLIGGGAGDDQINGEAGADSLYGSAGDDYLSGGTGNDLLGGSVGDDTLWGDGGQDSVFGAAGDDSILGNAGDDLLGGAAGNDTLLGGDGQDAVYGSLGDDSVYGNAGNDTLGGAAGDDTLLGGDGQDAVYGSLGDDSVDGGAGNDTVGGFTGNDTVSGGDGDDRLWGSDGNDSLLGGDGNDSIGGGRDDDTVFGGFGDDELYGGTGDDSLSGGDGNDLFYGVAGDDTIAGGAGDDTIFTGSGADLVIYESGIDTLRFFSLSEDRLQIDDGLYGGGLTVAQVIDQFGNTAGSDFVLDFGDGDQIVFANAGSAAGLESQIDIV